MTLKIISGIYKGRLLKTPRGNQTRPTQAVVREALFNMCQNEIEGARFLDLYAGSGAMGLEALSRGASQVTLIEQRREAGRCIRENIGALRIQTAFRFLALPVERALEQMAQEAVQFDILYADPPYGTPLFPIVEKLLSNHLFAPNARLFLEELYDPKTAPFSCNFPELLPLPSHRFGSTLLLQYRFSTRS